MKLQERCAAHGIGCEVEYPGAVGVKHKTPTDYLVATLKGSAEPDVQGSVLAMSDYRGVVFPTSDSVAIDWAGEWGEVADGFELAYYLWRAVRRVLSV